MLEGAGPLVTGDAARTGAGARALRTRGRKC
jgi:hypothetical protein